MSYFSIAMAIHNVQGNLEKKVLNLSLRFAESMTIIIGSMVAGRQAAGRQAGRDGTWAIAESVHLDPQDGGTGNDTLKLLKP